MIAGDGRCMCRAKAQAADRFLVITPFLLWPASLFCFFSSHFFFP